MRLNKLIVIVPTLILSITVACKTKKAATITKTETVEKPKVETAAAVACPDKVTFETLKPLLSKSCTFSGCHDVFSYNMNFTQYAILKQFAVEGEVKKHVLEIKNMPPNEKLTAQELALVKCWLDGGMLEK